jgi:hypothetical protein
MQNRSVEKPCLTQDLTEGEPVARVAESQTVITSDPIVELYKRDVDRSLLRENLRRTIDERLRMNAEVVAFGDALARARRAAERPSD